MPKDIDIFEEINKLLMTPPPLKVERLPTFYPSAASCYDETSGPVGEQSVLGSCLRAQYFRCAGFSKTNPSGLFSQFIFAAGNMWEDKITEWIKQTGLWVGNSIKFQDLDRYVSGEVDIVVKIPETEEIVIIENKTYSSANYKAKKEITGGRDMTPRPKDQNLLQSFLYLGQFADQGIKKVYLTYFDRACGGPDNNKQFIITTHQENGKTYPRLSTDYRGEKLSWIDKRVTIEGIYYRYAELMDHLKKGQIPKPDFKITFNAQEVEQKRSQDIIAKTRYEAWQRNAEKYPIGDWQCSYCDFRDLCQTYQDEGK